MYTLKKGTKCVLKTHNTNYGFWKSEIAPGWRVQSYTSLVNMQIFYSFVCLIFTTYYPGSKKLLNN